jgi:tetratricopeptide (TPR) repeat protein
MSISSRFGFCAALAAVAIVASASPAHAEDKKAVKRIEEANAKAMEEYDLLEFESAKKILNGALVDIKKAGLGGHPVAAKTHGNLGIVYEGLGDADNALLEFIAALEIDPKWQLPKEYKKPELAKIYETARSTVGKGGGGGGGTTAATPGAAATTSRRPT